MKILIYILMGLVIAVGAGSLIKQDTGQVVIALSDYSIQANLGFFVLLTIAAFLVFYFLLRTIGGFLDFPKKYQHWKIARGHKKSEYFLTQGMLALFECNWARAEKMLNKGAKYSRLPMINYLGAARAAQKSGATDRRDSYLRQAYSDDTNSEYVVGLTRAELELKQNQTEQAYATLRHIDAKRPGQNQVKLMLLEASTELNDWEQSLSILEDLENSGGLSLEKVRARQLQGYAYKLTNSSKSGEVQDVIAAWNSLPRKLKKELYLLEVYVRNRLLYPDTTDCEVMLRRVIKRNPDPALVRLYGKVQGENPAKQLAFIERLLKEHPSDYSVQITAGRLYKRAEIWGKAISCLEKSLQLEPSSEAYYELATLFESRGDSEKSGAYFREGLALAAKPVSPMTALEMKSGILKLPESHLD